jgi:hypothetical protein
MACLEEEQEYKVFKVMLQSLDGKFQCTVPVLDQKKICNYVPYVEKKYFFS